LFTGRRLGTGDSLDRAMPLNGSGGREMAHVEPPLPGPVLREAAKMAAGQSLLVVRWIL
jgi:hypothetical protein